MADDPLERLWQRARDDTPDLDDVEVRRIQLEGGPEDGKRFAQHLPPGTMAKEDGILLLSAGEVAAINANPTVHRIAHCTEVEHEGLLGLMRSSLEHVRQFEGAPGSYTLSNVTNGSTDQLYGGRAGGAVVYLAMPMMRDGTAAGGRLIRRVYGPQFGKHYDRFFGPFYRTEREPGPLDSLPLRTVTFAALHAEAFEEHVGRGIREHLLREAHPEALDWWEKLMDDELFGHLRKSAPAYDPPVVEIEEIERHGGNAPMAWRPLEALLDRALDHGLYVLSRT